MDYSIFIKICGCLARQRHLPPRLGDAVKRATAARRIVRCQRISASDRRGQKALAWLRRFSRDQQHVQACKLYLLCLYRVGTAIDDLRKSERARVCVMLARDGIKMIF